MLTAKQKQICLSQANIQCIVNFQTSMKSAGLLKGWRMHGRRGMVNHLPLHPRAPCQSCSGVGSSSRDSTSAIEHCRTAPWHLPPFFGDWGVLWCLARCSFRAHEVRGQRLFPHLCVGGASVDLLALFFFLLNVEIFAQLTELKLDQVSFAWPHVFSSGGCAALIMIWKQE